MRTRKSSPPKIAPEHAYHQTRSMLRARRSDMAVKLQRHGVRLLADVLDDPRRQLLAQPESAMRIGRAIASLREGLDKLGQAIQPGLRQAL